MLSVLCTLHARCGTRAACTCFSAAPHAHQAASAFAGPPAAPTARHGPPNSVITVCYRSQPSVLEMYVVKRSGKKEPVHFDKITARIAKLCYGLDQVKVQPVLVAQKVRAITAQRPSAHRRWTALTTTLALAQVCAGVYPDVTTKELDDLAAETAAYMSTGTRRRQRNARANSCPAAGCAGIGKYWASGERRWRAGSGALRCRQRRAPPGRVGGPGLALGAQCAAQSGCELNGRWPQITLSTRCWRRGLRCPTCTRRRRRASSR